MTSLRTLIAGFGLALAVAVPAALAQEQGAGPVEDPVVARVDGEEILRSEVLAMASSLPPQYQSQIMQIYPALVQRLIDFRLAGRLGRAEGLANDDEVKARVAAAEERAIRDVYLERAIEARVTDEGLKSRYEEFVVANPPSSEQRARHILLKTKEEARDIIAELDAGADFAELAKEHSTGPSAAQGGDLGYFTAEQMVPEFAQAAAALDPGSYSAEPTQTQFGWHVIKLEDRRQVPTPSFEEMEDQLRQELSTEAVEAILADLRDGAEIEILPPGRSLMGEAGTAQ